MSVPQMVEEFGQMPYWDLQENQNDDSNDLVNHFLDLIHFNELAKD